VRQLRVLSALPSTDICTRTLYFREPNDNLFEIASDGPGCAADELLESLGEDLSLLPLLEPRGRDRPA
jgi:glyoxalase family protein